MHQLIPPSSVRLKSPTICFYFDYFYGLNFYEEEYDYVSHRENNHSPEFPVFSPRPPRFSTTSQRRFSLQFIVPKAENKIIRIKNVFICFAGIFIFLHIFIQDCSLTLFAVLIPILKSVHWCFFLNCSPRVNVSQQVVCAEGGILLNNTRSDNTAPTPLPVCATFSTYIHADMIHSPKYRASTVGSGQLRGILDIGLYVCM